MKDFKSNMLKNSNFYKYLGFGLFGCSAIITMMYMWSTALGFIPTLIVLIQGIAIEYSKMGFSYISITVKGFGWKALFGCLALFAFCFSIVFTFGFNTIMANRVHNNNLYQSGEYAKKDDDMQRKKDLYAQTKKDLDDLKADKANQISGMEKTRDQWGKNYKTQKSLEQDKINAKSAEFDEKIESKQNDLKKIDQELNGVNINELPEDGYESMYNMFAKTLNEFFADKKKKNEKKPWTAEDIQFWLTTGLSLFFELAGIGSLLYSHHLCEKKDDENLSPTPTTPSPDPDKKTIPQLTPEVINALAEHIANSRSTSSLKLHNEIENITQSIPNGGSEKLPEQIENISSTPLATEQNNYSGLKKFKITKKPDTMTNAACEIVEYEGIVQAKNGAIAGIKENGNVVPFGRKKAEYTPTQITFDDLINKKDIKSNEHSSTLSNFEKDSNAYRLSILKSTDFLRYIEHMYANLTVNGDTRQSPAYTRIARELKLDVEIGRMIHKFLCKEGIVETDAKARRTYVVKTIDEVMKLIEAVA